MDYVKLGMMKAEFEVACSEIDNRLSEAKHGLMQDAYQAVLRGDLAERDRLCNEKWDKAEDARKKAKTEAWLRIGEKHGIGRDDALASLKKVYQ